MRNKAYLAGFANGTNDAKRGERSELSTRDGECINPYVCNYNQGYRAGQIEEAKRIAQCLKPYVRS
jgi:hypothetical protein